MAKTKISEFSANPANNTDIDSINLAEGCAPSGINDAIRELMAQLKDFQAGTAGDSFNGPIGTTTAAAGVFTTLSASGAVTLSAATANGVVYANGSKVLTTGSALTFDGSTFQADTSGFRIGKSPADSPSAYIYASVIADVNQTSELWIGANTASVVGGSFLSGLGFYNTDNTTPGANLSGIKAYIKDSTGSMYLNFYAGNTYYAANTPQYTIDPAYHAWFSGTTEGMRLTSTGLGIGTSSPGYKLDVSTSSTTGARITTAEYGQLVVTDGARTTYIQNYNNVAAIGTSSNTPLILTTNGTERLRLDTSGNLGLGVTPSANDYTGAFQLKWIGHSLTPRAADNLALTMNAYHSGGGWKYGNTGVASFYGQAGGQHLWYTAPSGTAGNAISFTQALSLTAAGNLLLGGTTDPGGTKVLYIGNGTTPSTPTSGGVLYVESGALKYKGSSGTVTTLGAA